MKDGGWAVDRLMNEFLMNELRMSFFLSSARLSGHPIASCRTKE